MSSKPEYLGEKKLIWMYWTHLGTLCLYFQCNLSFEEDLFVQRSWKILIL